MESNKKKAPPITGLTTTVTPNPVGFEQTVSEKIKANPSILKRKETPEQLGVRMRAEVKAYEKANYQGTEYVGKKDAVFDYAVESMAGVREQINSRATTAKSQMENTATRANQTYEDIAKSLAVSFTHGNGDMKMLSAGVDEFFNAPDLKFEATKNAETIGADLMQRGLNPSAENIRYMMKSNNKVNYDSRIGTMAKDQEYVSFAQAHLTSATYTGSSVAGAFTAPSNFAYAPISMFNRLSGGVKLAAVSTTNAGLQYTIAQARNASDPSRTGFDTAIDVTFGALLDGAIAYKMGARASGSTKEALTPTAVADAHATTATMAQANRITPTIKYDFSKSYTFKTMDETTIPTTKIGEEAVTLKYQFGTYMQKYENVLESIRGLTKEGEIADTVKYNELRQDMKQTVRELTDKLSKATDKNEILNLSEELDFIRNVAKNEKLDKLDAKFLKEEKASVKTKDDTKKTQYKQGKVAYEQTKIKLDKEARRKQFTKYHPLVKDSTGEPKIFFHGTTSTFDKFDDTFLGKATGAETTALGHFFTTSAEVAGRFAGKKGSVIQSRLKLKKPFVINADDEAGEMGKFIDEHYDNLAARGSNPDSFRVMKYYAEIKYNGDFRAMKDDLIRKGYDGIVIKDTLMDANTGKRGIEEHSMFVSFKSENIMNKFDETDVPTSLLKQKELYERMASVVDEITTASKKAFNDLVVDMFPTKEQRDAFAKTVQDEISKVTGEPTIVKFDGDEMIVAQVDKMTIDKDGIVDFHGSKIPLAVLLTMAGSSAVFAEDGGNVITSNLPALVFIAIALYATKGKFKQLKAEYNGVGNMVEAMVDKVKSTELISTVLDSEKNKSFDNLRGALADTANTTWLNSFEHVKAYGSDTTKEVMGKLGFNALNPDSNKFGSSILNVQALTHADMIIMHTSMREHYQKWLDELGMHDSLDEQMQGVNSGTDKELQFSNDVAYFVEFGDNGKNFPKAVSDMAKVSADIFSKNGKKGADEKLIGFTDEILEKEGRNYLPHMPQHEAFRECVELGGKEQLIEKIGNAIVKKQGTDRDAAEELAIKMVNHFSKVRHGGNQDPQDIQDLINAMKRAGMPTEGLYASELAASVRGNNNAMSRGKFRIEMDLSDFGEIVLDGRKGVDATFNINTLWDRDIMSLVQNHAHSIHGAVELKRATKGIKIDGKVIEDGIMSEHGLQSIIAKEPNRRSYRILQGHIDYIMGRALNDPADMEFRVVNTLKNLVNVDLIYSAIMSMGEVASTSHKAVFGSGKTVRKHYFNKMFDVVRPLAGLPKSEQPLVLKRLVAFMGTGSSMIRNDATVRSADAISGNNKLVNGTAIEGFSDYVRAVALKVSQNMRVDDYVKQLSMLHHHERIARALEDMEITKLDNGEYQIKSGKYKLSDGYMRMTGLTPELMMKLQGKFKLERNGDELNLADDFDDDMDELLGYETASQFRSVLYRAVLKDSPEEVLSTMPIEKHTSAAGKLHSVFAGFALQSYASKGLATLKYGDSEDIMSTLIYMAGLGLGLYSKEALKGNDPDLEEVMYNTLLMMPILAPAGVYQLATENPAVGIINQLTRQTGNLAAIAYPED